MRLQSDRRARAALRALVRSIAAHE